MEEQKRIILENDKRAQHLNMLFSLFKAKEQTYSYGEKTYFNNTEIRLIGEILSAKYEGRRLISTRLADNLGVTRSAISQIVNKLEEEGIVERIPDDVDRKIAYIDVTEKALEKYGADFKLCANFVENIVKKFGEAKFEKMCGMFEDFFKMLQSEKMKKTKK